MTLDNAHEIDKFSFAFLSDILSFEDSENDALSFATAAQGRPPNIAMGALGRYLLGKQSDNLNRLFI